MDNRQKTELLALLSRISHHIPKDNPDQVQAALAFCDILRDELVAAAQAPDEASRLDWLEDMHNVPGKQCSRLGFHIISPSPRGWTLDREFGGTEHANLREAIDVASAAK